MRLGIPSTSALAPSASCSGCTSKSRRSRVSGSQRSRRRQSWISQQAARRRVSRFSIKNIAERRTIAEAVVVPMLKGIRDRKVKSTYDRLAPDRAGRIYTVLSPDTASFRMSSGGSLLQASATNLQNIEKKVAKLDPLYQVRDIFVPDEGYELITVDYSGAEA